MSEPIELMRLLAQPADRRCWLLFKALESFPPDQAADWARTAEAFIVGSTVSSGAEEPAVSPDPTLEARKEARPGRQSTNRQSLHRSQLAWVSGLGIQKRSRLDLSPERCEQLLQRLAQGARNAELATEFGLTSQQVQGVRIGLARKNARGREQRVPTQPASDQTPAIGVTVDEVVRYLRQQDDVVVSADHGAFLVNGRFKLDLTDLVARANRMRTRQGKPGFQLSTRLSTSAGQAGSANGHPMFWPHDAASPTSPEHH